MNSSENLNYKGLYMQEKLSKLLPLKPGTIIYFIGIGGIGMSSLAQIFAALGYQVQGSDTARSYITDKLLSSGIKVFIGQDQANIPENTGYVIYSSAIKNDNCEFLACQTRGIKLIHRAEALAFLLASSNKAIGVAGTHGKTSTTAMLATLMKSCNKSPTIINGGFINDLQSNALLGDEDITITETDESDKSFLLLPLNNAIVTNIDKEHLENYNNSFKELLDAYKEFIIRLPPDGALVYCYDDENLRQVVKEASAELKTQTFSYGLDPSSDVQIVTYEANSQGTSFEITFKLQVSSSKLNHLSNKSYKFFIPTYGRHNILNMTGALVMAILLGCVDITGLTLGVESFAGVKRRFTIVKEFHGMTLIDDYAHHPVEIKSVLEMARLMLLNRPQTLENKIIVVFQPHRYSRLAVLSKEFAEELSKADVLFISEVYGAGEAQIPGVNSANLLAKCKEIGCQAIALEKKDDLNFLLPKVGKRGDLVIFMGAGDITNWPRELEESKS